MAVKCKINSQQVKQTNEVKQRNVSSSQPPTPIGKKKRGYYIKNSCDLKRMISGLTSQVLTGELSTEKYRSAVYGASIIIRCLEHSLLEQKIVELENKLGLVKG